MFYLCLRLMLLIVVEMFKYISQHILSLKAHDMKRSALICHPKT